MTPISSAFCIFGSGINRTRMISTTDIRNKVIDQLMAIKDAEFLRALSDMIDRAHVQENAIQLTEEQKIMLTMSAEDIQAGRTIEHITLDERELEWQYNRELEEVDEEIERGEFLSHEEALKEIRSWREQ